MRRRQIGPASGNGNATQMLALVHQQAVLLGERHEPAWAFHRAHRGHGRGPLQRPPDRRPAHPSSPMTNFHPASHKIISVAVYERVIYHLITE